MYDIFIGNQRSIVFPIMCNAHISISYNENVPDIFNTPSDLTDDIPYGIWAHEGSFTFEAIVTPYDINGMGAGGLRERSAKKIDRRVMPPGGTNTLSEEYLPVTNRYTHEMCLFHNDNFRITLANTTTNNNNQPAEYKIKVYLTIDSIQQVFESPAVFICDSDVMWYEGDINTNYNYTGFDKNGRKKFDSYATLTSNYTTGTSISCDTHGTLTNLSDFFSNGDTVYVRDGFTFTSIGTIANVTNSAIILNSAYNTAISNGSELFLDAFKEPSYVNNMNHIGITFNETNNSINIFFNKRKIFTGTHTQTGTFSFSRTDCFIGKNTNADNNAHTDMQYMGEIHELSLEREAKKAFMNTNSLFPFFDKTLLHIRFEEVDA
tara:strand:+ start:392 stop:1522 length:1131 start_codon:yes stop_codon:yes gene_type:complete